MRYALPASCTAALNPLIDQLLAQQVAEVMIAVLGLFIDPSMCCQASRPSWACMKAKRNLVVQDCIDAGQLSNAQIEAVVYAFMRFEKRLTNSEAMHVVLQRLHVMNAHLHSTLIVPCGGKNAHECMPA